MTRAWGDSPAVLKLALSRTRSPIGGSDDEVAELAKCRAG